MTCSCSKMRYKAEFRPSDLLCMHLGCWVPADRAVPALDEDMHCVISQVEPLCCSSNDNFFQQLPHVTVIAPLIILSFLL